MTISLTTATGQSVSAFGSGNSAYAQGQQTNAGAFSSGNSFGQLARSGLSGAGSSRNTISPASQTFAGDTSNMGYKTLGGQNRGARGGGSIGGSGRVPTIPTLTTDETIGIPETDTAKLPGNKPEATPVYQVAAPQEPQSLGESLGRLKNFAAGAWSGRPGGTGSAGADVGDLAEDVAL